MFVIPNWDRLNPTGRAILLACLWLPSVVLALVAHVFGPANSSLILLGVNQVATPTWVMKKIGLRLVNNVKFAATVQRSYDDQYVVAGAKVGYLVNARLPQRYQVNKGAALNPVPIIDSIVPITLTDQANIGIEFSTASLTMEIDDYAEKCVAPAVDALTNVIDYDGLSRMYQAVSKVTGNPGVIPGSTGTLPQAANQVYLNAGTKLNNAAVPFDGRIAILSSDMHAYLANANVAVFNPAALISENTRRGQFAKMIFGFEEWYLDQNVATHTVGAPGSTPLVNTGAQSGSTISIDGLTATTGFFNVGDVIQFAGCYDINPLNYQTLPNLKDFVVTALTTADGTGAIAALPISPSLIPNVGNNPLATCSASPADNAAITLFGAVVATYSNVLSPQGLCFSPEAFALVMADLELPGGLWVSERLNNKALGISIRFLKGYDIMSDISPARVDVLYGWAAVRETMATRIAS